MSPGLSIFFTHHSRLLHPALRRLLVPEVLRRGSRVFLPTSSVGPSPPLPPLPPLQRGPRRLTACQPPGGVEAPPCRPSAVRRVPPPLPPPRVRCRLTLRVQHVLFSGQHSIRLLRTWPRWRRRQRALAPTWGAMLPFLHWSRRPGRARRVPRRGRLRPAAVVLAAADDACLREAGAAAAAVPSPLSEAAKPLFRRMPHGNATTAAKAPSGAPLAAGLAVYDAAALAAVLSAGLPLAPSTWPLGAQL